MGAVLKLLGGVPLWAWALAALAAWGGWHRYQARAAKAEYAKAVSAAAAERAASAAEVAGENNRRLVAVQGASDAAHLQAERDRVAAAAARGAAERLRERIAAVQAAARTNDSAAAGQCQAAHAATTVLADVQRRIDDAAGQLAAYADSARTAGQACERAYDALSVATPPKGNP